MGFFHQIVQKLHYKITWSQQHNYINICIVFYITVLLTTFNKKKRFEIYPKVSYTPNILPDVHVINFTKKKEQAVNSLD